MTLRAVLLTRSGDLGELQRCAAAGLRRQGIEVDVSAMSDPSADFVICWGWRRGHLLKSRGQRVLVMERGYIGDRFHWTSLAWDGLNNRGNFCLPREPMPARFWSFFEMSPWKAGGDYVVVMGQVPGDASLQGKNLKLWYPEALQLARQRYGLPAHLRPHPVVVKRGVQRPDPVVGGPLNQALARAAAVVVWNSNSAVDAVLAGVPTVALDQGTMAWPVVARQIGDIAKPDRTEWANRLSWCQWSPDELASGVWWERMKLGLSGA